MPSLSQSWPHAPTHRLAESGTYIVTAATYRKLHHFKGARRLGVLSRGLLKLAAQYRWQMEAWAVFSNHYHFVGHAPNGQTSAESLAQFLQQLHQKTAVWINRLDLTEGRKVWHNYWETQLTFERSYFARLSYVHQNAVKHGLVPIANQYPWCSAGWFERSASGAQIRTVYGFKVDQVRVLDDYDVAAEW